MPDRRASSRHQGSDHVDGPLVDRVRGKVRSVTYALQRRDRRSGSAPSRPAPSAGGSLEPPNAIPLSLELRALRVVYHSMGRAHRRYRERTGEHVSPPLKAAARAFTQEPSLLSLVPVASFLDDLRLLPW